MQRLQRSSTTEIASISRLAEYPSQPARYARSFKVFGMSALVQETVIGHTRLNRIQEHGFPPSDSSYGCVAYLFSFHTSVGNGVVQFPEDFFRQPDIGPLWCGANELASTTCLSRYAERMFEKFSL